MKNKVGIIAGSKSDLPIIEKCVETLKKLGIEYDVVIASAHRTPEKVKEFASNADKKYDAVISAAGHAAHLGGVVASMTLLPVIGIPINSSPLLGLDALLATVQMPGGIPIATVSIGDAGAVNSAVLAARIIALGNENVKAKLVEYVEGMKASIEKANEDLNI